MRKYELKFNHIVRHVLNLINLTTASRKDPTFNNMTSRAYLKIEPNLKREPTSIGFC